MEMGKGYLIGDLRGLAPRRRHWDVEKSYCCSACCSASRGKEAGVFLFVAADGMRWTTAASVTTHQHILISIRRLHRTSSTRDTGGESATFIWETWPGVPVEFVWDLILLLRWEWRENRMGSLGGVFLF